METGTATPAAQGASEYASVWSDLMAVPFQQAYIDANGIRTRLLASGELNLPLLLFLHGTGGHAEAFSRNLGAHGRHFRTVAFDMIGHGWSDKPAGDYEIADYARHVLDVMDALGAQRAHISGESLGGWVATYLAVHHPDRVDKLVLNTAGGWTAHPEVMQRIRTLSLAAARRPTRDVIRARLEFLLCDTSKVSEDLVSTRLAIYSQPGFIDVMQRVLCLQDMETRRRNMITATQYAAITSPTLVLWTSHDPTATPDEGKQIADMIPGSAYVVMNACGHWPQWEDPEVFNRLHLDFLLGRVSAAA